MTGYPRTVASSLAASPSGRDETVRSESLGRVLRPFLGTYPIVRTHHFSSAWKMQEQKKPPSTNRNGWSDFRDTADRWEPPPKKDDSALSHPFLEKEGVPKKKVGTYPLVRAARGGAHLRARVVNKNQTDRQKQTELFSLAVKKYPGPRWAKLKRFKFLRDLWNHRFPKVTKTPFA